MDRLGPPATCFRPPRWNFCGSKNATDSGTCFVTLKGSLWNPQIRIANVIGIAIAPPMTMPTICPMPLFFF